MTDQEYALRKEVNKWQGYCQAINDFAHQEGSRKYIGPSNKRVSEVETTINLKIADLNKQITDLI